MPASFSRLRIAGFKSFAEPATIEILPGLTGVVGPNGCGKSNVVEALRWVMGENNARSLRGGEMDDVIFAGSVARASRNVAEVTLLLDHTQGGAPPPFHEQPELEISRRIERGSGSTFRVNGREVRARDVQTLLADLSSGAHTSAMVSQGRVSSLITSRPDQRRAILEEAAGITGLHARRHEAEIRLRAAEANLERAEDLRGELETRLVALKRQARQATRFRNLSSMLREAQATLLALQRARVTEARAAADAALHAARVAAATATEQATGAAAIATKTAALIPPLRAAEAAARTALERGRVAHEQVAAEEQRATEALAMASRALEQINRDLAHAEQVSRDALADDMRLATEDRELAQAGHDHGQRDQDAGAEAREAAQAARTAELEANRATEVHAEANAQAHAASQLLGQSAAQAKRVNEQLARLRGEHSRLVAAAVDPAVLATAEAEQAEAEAAALAGRRAAEEAEQARVAARSALGAAREAHSAVAATLAKRDAEAQAIAEILAVKDGERWRAVVDALRVPAGLETALGAALGEALTAADDPEAPRHWRAFPPPAIGPRLPPMTTPLDSLVEAPAALARALAQIGVLDDDDGGDRAQATLLPGQIIVSRAGGVWRWDGYTVRAGAPSATAVRLQQRNRLAGLQSAVASDKRRVTEAKAAEAAAEAGERQAIAGEQRTRAARSEAEARLERARRNGAQLRSNGLEAAAKLQAVDQQIAQLARDASEADAALQRARQAHTALRDVSLLRRAVEDARLAAASARTREAETRRRQDTLVREHEAREHRRRAIAKEREDRAMRAADAGARVVDLARRRQQAETEQRERTAEPARIAGRRSFALEELEAAESAYRRTAGELNLGTTRQATADRDARAAEAALATARETFVRAEGAAEQALQAWGVVAERIVERLGANPPLPDPGVDVGPAAEEKAKRHLDRLLREREEVGPVNLRADIEAEEMETQIASAAREREELSTAISKLRGSIGHINREGRERLSAVFLEVDRHFQTLFSRMFGGGRAHLSLVGSEDALEAGLEIYAQPPGKKLSTLSLLSGGEQALTAMSLIFAVFRCNPAPVCVLDEVDAPLDDANVERFCALLDDLVRDTGTRFMVVTHHHLTMARMDRLYGVTMQERGVSRLLSVDLQSAAGIAEPPRMAAE